MAEKTKTEDEVENKVLIEKMVQEAEKVGEPGELQKGSVVHGGDGDVPSPMVMSELKSAGHTYIYNTRTGDRSVVNLNMLRRKLQLKRADSRPVYTTVKPEVTPTLGEYKCRLHKDDPDRKHFDSLGLAVCPKATLNSPYQVRRHMMKKHKMEWDAIEQERTDKEKKEDREFQKTLMNRVVEVKPEEKAPLYVSDKDKKKVKTK